MNDFRVWYPMIWFVAICWTLLAGQSEELAGADAIQNPDKVACIFAENPVMRSLTMSKSPLVESLDSLAKAGVPLLHDCGSLDPWLAGHTRLVEQKYKALGGKITVIIKEGQGHFPLKPEDPKVVVDFIAGHQQP